MRSLGILSLALLVFAGVHVVLHLPVNSCGMSRMYPGFLPFHTNSLGYRSWLFGIREFPHQLSAEHLSRANLIVAFVPGSGGSFQQIRSIGARLIEAFPDFQRVKVHLVFCLDFQRKT